MMKQTIFRTYTELSKLDDFNSRFAYLKLDGSIGESTFGFDRYLNQALYRSNEWKKIRREVILRDNGWDLGVEGYYAGDRPVIHHMNPIVISDIEKRNPDIFNPEYLICVSFRTHNAIHYGDELLLPKIPEERKPWDTCPWKGGIQ